MISLFLGYSLSKLFIDSCPSVLGGRIIYLIDVLKKMSNDQMNTSDFFNLDCLLRENIFIYDFYYLWKNLILILINKSTFSELV